MSITMIRKRGIGTWALAGIGIAILTAVGCGGSDGEAVVDVSENPGLAVDLNPNPIDNSESTNPTSTTVSPADPSEADLELETDAPAKTRVALRPDLSKQLATDLEQAALSSRPSKLPSDGASEVAPPKLVKQETLTVEDENEKLKIRYEAQRYSDNSTINHGLYEEFYSNGEKYAVGHFEDGKVAGEWKYWHRNGQVAKVGGFEGGKPEGQWTYFRKSGKLRATESYKTGLRDGEWLFYYEDGETLLGREEYEVGQPHGAWLAWYEPGKDSDAEELTKKLEINYNAGQKHGVWRYWFENGQLFRDESYQKDLPHGTFKRFHEDGTPVGTPVEYDKGQQKES